MQHCNILISSAGRRNYLVSWFREALVANGIDGRIVVADSDENTPTRADADSFCVLPPIDSVAYLPSLMGICEREKIHLALSLNDHELSLWSTLGRSAFEDLGVTLVALPQDTQLVIEDKLRMGDHLSEHGLSVPLTYTGTSVVSGECDARNLGDRLVIKNRYGSGSSGLTFSTPTDVFRDVRAAALAARNRHGIAVLDIDEGLESVVVQSRIDGVEFGVDVVNDLSAQFATVLAREKLNMRAGETDQAKSEASDRFMALGESLSSALSHIGLVDTDVIEDAEGRQWLIDVNPRFGGGYPFSHLAGANIPRAYVAWACGLQLDPEWLASQPGVLSSKCVDIRKVRTVDVSNAALV